MTEKTQFAGFMFLQVVCRDIS